MKNTSRRSFGKQLTGAVAALSVSALGAEGQRPQPPSQHKFVTHDTPPPTDFLDGSFSIGTYHPLARELQNVGGNRWQYDMGDSVDAAIAHIRVLAGNGEIIYQNLEATGSIINIELENTASGQTFGTLVASATSLNGRPIFAIGSTHRLPFQNPAAGSSHRPQRYSHPGPGGNVPFRVSKITITSGANQFMVTAPNAGHPSGESQEYRIMVWHVGD